MRIVVSQDGKLEYLGTNNVEIVGAHVVTVRRASHIEPVNWLMRPLFHWLRKRFGDEGRVAWITRAWPVLWRVNLKPVNGPVFGRFIDRADAIAAEEDWLVRFRMGGSSGKVV